MPTTPYTVLNTVHKKSFVCGEQVVKRLSYQSKTVITDFKISWNVCLVYTESTQLHTTLHSVYIDTLSAVYMNSCRLHNYELSGVHKYTKITCSYVHSACIDIQSTQIVTLIVAVGRISCILHDYIALWCTQVY